MPNTPVHNLPYPLGSDAPNAPAQFQALATAVDDQLPIVSDTQPPPLPGLVWRDSTNGSVWISDGTQWFPIVADVGLVGALTAMVSTSTASMANNATTQVTGWGPDAQQPAHGYWYTSAPGVGGAGLVTFNMPGIYLCIARVNLGGSGANAGRRNTRLSKNANAVVRETSISSASGQSVVEVSAIFDMQVGDTLGVQVWQNVGVAVALAGSHYWQITRLGPLPGASGITAPTLQIPQPRKRAATKRTSTTKRAPAGKRTSTRRSSK